VTGARAYAAEFFGTLLLVFAGVCTAVGGLIANAQVAVALAFGLVLVALTYTIGPVSGCHVNPAVTLGSLLSGTTPLGDAVGYWIAQLAGGIVASLIVWGLVRWGGVVDHTGTLGANGYGVHINAGGAMVLEVVLTFLLVLVVLMVTGRPEQTVVVAVPIGLALGVANLVGVPLDGASVNPARSLGPALFHGGTALSQVWVFLIFPLIGGVLAAMVAPLLKSQSVAGRP
jgi:aquaporin Z